MAADDDPILDRLNRLTLAELDEGSRKLGADMVESVAEGTALRWKGLALLAWLVTRREDRAAKVDDFMAMTTDEMLAALGVGEDDLEVADAGEDEGQEGADDPLRADPTDPAPAPS